MGISPEEQQINRYMASGAMVAIDDVLVGAIELHATIRAEAKGIIEGLRQRNIKSIYILTGDVEMPTKKLAQELGVNR